MSQLIDPQLSGQFDRLPPHDIEAEQCTIASMIMATTRDEFEKTRRGLHRDHFYQTDHQIYFDALCRLRDEGGKADATMIRAELIRVGLYEDCGGFKYLAQLCDTVPGAALGPHYAAIVREHFVIRSCIALSNEVIRECYAHPRRVAGDIAAAAVRELSSLATTGEADRIIKLSEAIENVITRITDKSRAARIATEITALDDIVGGVPIGKFTMIAGRPGMGKSLLLKQILRNVAQHTSVGVVTIEEDNEKIAENSLSAESGIENNKIVRGELAQEEWTEVTNAQIRLDNLPFFIADRPTTLAEVETAITALAVQHKCKVIGLDFIQCVDANEQNENREITLVSRAIKACFKRLGVAGVACVQLNRGPAQGDGRRPTLKDLRGSGSLEQDGDLILMLHSEDYYRRERGDGNRDGKLEVIIAKNKDGPLADVPLKLDLRTQSVSEWEDQPPHFMGGSI